MAKDKIIATLKVEQRVYDDSPQVTVTYKDLSRFIDHLIDIIETDKKEVGFKA